MNKTSTENESIGHRANDRRIKRWKNDSGQVVIALVIMLPFLFGIMGLCIDVAGFYAVKRFTQTAADAGAKAGASELQKGSSHSVVVAAAQKDVTSNGYTDATNDATVVVNHPPATGPHTGDSNFVEIIVTKSQTAFFMRLLVGNQLAAVRGRAVGGLVGSGASSLVVLDPAGPQALELKGTSDISVDGAVVVDSANAAGLAKNNGSTMIAGSIGVVGGYTGSGYTPTPVTGVIPVDDPLSSLAPPSFSAGCDHTNFSTSVDATLSPGRYCGGITTAGHAVVTFTAGTYVLIGGGFDARVQSTLNGTGVTFYNTFDATHPFGPISLSTQVNATLTAPTSGAMAGMLFFQDRNVTGATAANDFQAGAILHFTGAMYFHKKTAQNQQVNWGGGGAVGGPWFIIVADRIALSGHSNLTSDFTPGIVPSPIRKPTLVE